MAGDPSNSDELARSELNLPTASRVADSGRAAVGSGSAAVGSASLAIDCQGLGKTFRDFWLRPRVRAVQGVDLRVQRGEVFGLLGPNGSGKSTIIKMLLGLLFPSEGSIKILEQAPSDVTVKSRLGYLPEESHLYPFLTARETLEYTGRLLRIPKECRQQRTEELLQMVGLSAAEGRPVGEYSKGMQRRIGLAQALINDPELLILDEPTSGLDPIGTRQVKDLVLELHRRGKTVLLTSHLLADVEELCTRVVVLYGGKVHASGTVEELLTNREETRVRTPALTRAQLDQLELWLQEQGSELLGSESPRQTLEALFIDVVEQARTDGALTSGALSGQAMAPFLAESRTTGGSPKDGVGQAPEESR